MPRLWTTEASSIGLLDSLALREALADEPLPPQIVGNGAASPYRADGRVMREAEALLSACVCALPTTAQAFALPRLYIDCRVRV